MDGDGKPSFIERLTSLLLREPDDREQLLEILHAAYERNLMDADALTIIEGALAADTRVTDVMIPRAQMDVVDIDDPLDEIIPFVIEAAHLPSRSLMVTATRFSASCWPKICAQYTPTRALTCVIGLRPVYLFLNQSASMYFPNSRASRKPYGDCR